MRRGRPRRAPLPPAARTRPASRSASPARREGQQHAELDCVRSAGALAGEAVADRERTGAALRRPASRGAAAPRPRSGSSPSRSGGSPSAQRPTAAASALASSAAPWSTRLEQLVQVEGFREGRELPSPAEFELRPLELLHVRRPPPSERVSLLPGRDHDQHADEGGGERDHERGQGPAPIRMGCRSPSRLMVGSRRMALRRRNASRAVPADGRERGDNLAHPSLSLARTCGMHVQPNPSQEGGPVSSQPPRGDGSG